MHSIQQHMTRKPCRQESYFRTCNGLGQSDQSYTDKNQRWASTSSSDEAGVSLRCHPHPLIGIASPPNLANTFGHRASSEMSERHFRHHLGPPRTVMTHPQRPTEMIDYNSRVRECLGKFCELRDLRVVKPAIETEPKLRQFRKPRPRNHLTA